MLNARIAVSRLSFSKMKLPEIVPNVKVLSPVPGNISDAVSGVQLHQSIGEIYARSSGNQKTDFLAGLHKVFIAYITGSEYKLTRSYLKNNTNINKF